MPAVESVDLARGLGVVREGACAQASLTSPLYPVRGQLWCQGGVQGLASVPCREVGGVSKLE